MKPFYLSTILIINAFLSFSQERKELNYTVKLEGYFYESYIYHFNGTYAGQTGMFQLSYPIGKRFDLGINAGVYLHYRESRLAPNVYLYCPIQGALNFHTLKNRFAIEIATGFPIKLKEYKPYIVHQEFWYKDVYDQGESPEEQFQQNEIYKRQSIFLVSNFNLKFRVKNTQRLYFTTGIRMMNFRRGFKEYGLNQPEYVLKNIETYLNTSLGLEFRF